MIASLLATDGYICVNKTLIRRIGLNAAVLLGELCSEYMYWQKTEQLADGMFYSTRENIEENTGFSAYQQREILKALQDLNFIECKLKGVPSKMYYQINEQTILDYFNQDSVKEVNSKGLKNSTSNSEKIKDLNAEKFRPNYNNNYNKKKNKSLATMSKILSKMEEYDFSKQTKDKIVLYFEDRISSGDMPQNNYLEAQFTGLSKYSEKEQIEAINLAIQGQWKSMLYGLEKNKKSRFTDTAKLSDEEEDRLQVQRDKYAQEILSNPNEYKTF